MTVEGWASEHEFPLPDGSGVWVVRAYEFPTSDAARIEWERVHGEWKGNEGNFSLWRTMLADGSAHLVVLCGRPEDLIEVGGESFDMPYDEAKQFALRRARVGADAFAEGTEEHVEQEMRYGEDTPVRIDSTTGYVKRWYRR